MTEQAQTWDDEQLRERAAFMARDWPVLNATQQRLLASEIYATLRRYLGVEREAHKRKMAELETQIASRQSYIDQLNATREHCRWAWEEIDYELGRQGGDDDE